MTRIVARATESGIADVAAIAFNRKMHWDNDHKQGDQEDCDEALVVIAFGGY
jgi:hypothetical protein